MTATRYDTDVLIVGAGPAGLTLGSELLRAGARFRIIDKLVEPVTQSQASVVHSRVQELFGFNGTLDRLHRRGHPMRPMLTRAFGRTIGLLRVDGLDAPNAAPWIVGQNYIEQQLASHLAEHGCAVERGVELQRVTQDDVAVRAEVRHADGRSETIVAAWLAGCDGPRSLVREQLGVKYEGFRYNDEFEFLLGDVHVRWSRPDTHGYTFLHDDGTILLFFPQEGMWRVIVSRPRVTENTRAALTVEELQALVDRYGPADAVLHSPVWLSRFGTQRRVAERLRVGRAFLVGDAAHQHIPLGGQGMNTGVSDAFNLGWKLGLVARGEAPEAILDSYFAERHPVAQTLVATTDRLFGNASRPKLPLKAWARIMGPIMFPKPFVQNRIKYAMSQLKISYRDSPYVHDYRPARARRGAAAGDRAPDAVLVDPRDGRTVRLFDLLQDRRHTALVLQRDGGAPADAAAALAREFGALIQVVVVRSASAPAVDRAGVRTLIDRDGEIAKRYGAGGAFLIRPDGYLAACASAGDEGRVAEFARDYFLAPSPGLRVAARASA